MTGAQVIGKYFPLSEIQAARFAQIGPLYDEWNKKINVISRKDIGNLYVQHVLHSLAIAKIIWFHPGTEVIDAGTGGGFPGIPLAILFPETRFILTDSIRKKIHVVKEIAGELGLTNCETRNARLEDLKDKADFVVCRAVAEIERLIKWTGKNIRSGEKHNIRNGLLALKGGELTDELSKLKSQPVIYSLSDYFTEEFFQTKKLVHIAV